MRSDLAIITGADKKKQVPEQQAVSMGRVGDFAIVNPYGFFCDQPNGALLRVLAPGVAIPCAVDRPADVEQGEPVFYHPVNNAKIIAKNDGSWLIESSEGSQPIVINCTQANINASESVNINSPITNLGVGGKLIARHDDPIVGGKIVASGVNTSI